MPHVGRPYPYHPKYWATECLFWPGFAPWRLFFPNQIQTLPPWDEISGAGDLVSGAGETVTDATQIFWTLSGFPFSALLTLKFSVEMEEFIGDRYVVYKAILASMTVPIGTAYYFQDFPQRAFGINVGNWWTLHDPLSARDGPGLVVRPATYAEGGSPF